MKDTELEYLSSRTRQLLGPTTNFKVLLCGGTGGSCNPLGGGLDDGLRLGRSSLGVGQVSAWVALACEWAKSPLGSL